MSLKLITIDGNNLYTNSDKKKKIIIQNKNLP